MKITGTAIIKHEVTVRLEGVGPVKREYGDGAIVPERMVIEYRTGSRIDIGGKWQLSAITLYGPMARKDGTPGAREGYERYVFIPKHLPPELLAYALKHLPATYPADWLAEGDAS